MSRHFLYRSIAFLLILAAITAGGYLYIIGNAKRDAQQTLNRLGFTAPTIGVTKYQKGRAFHLDINLDDEKLSTLKMISNPLPLVAGTMGSKTNETQITDLNVSGRLDRDTGLDITNWSASQLSPQHLPPLIIRKTTIGLMTPVGGLMVDINGQISEANQDGTKDVVLNIDTKQYELKFNTVWEGQIEKNGAWQYDITVNDAGFNLDKAQASRMSGWVTLQKTGALFPELAGQLKLGMLTFSPITLHNAEITFEGTYGQMTSIVKAYIAGFENMTLTVDTKPTEQARLIKAVIETPDKDDLLKVMAQLHDVKIWQNDHANISSLMLTEGNLKNLYNALRDKSADTYVLEISGTPLNLAGKIIGRKENNQSFVISLDPAQRNQ